MAAAHHGLQMMVTPFFVLRILCVSSSYWARKTAAAAYLGPPMFGVRLRTDESTSLHPRSSHALYCSKRTQGARE
jgi:hypothetical protein